MKKRYEIIFIALYFILNILNTYFLTSEILNHNIVSFGQSFSSEFFSFLGNFGFLMLFFVIGILIFKTPKRIFRYLVYLTLALNIVIIALGLYTKSYKLAFSIFNFTIFKNPTGGFGAKVAIDFIVEIFVNWRILAILPFGVMLAMFLRMKKHLSTDKISLSFKKISSVFCSIIILQVVSYLFFVNSLQNNWKYSTDYAQYGCQHTGVYNYYFSEFVFRADNRNIYVDEEEEKIAVDEIKNYNKNLSSYENFIDHKLYSNRDSQTGLLRDYNVFVIQMESTMNFTIDSEFNSFEVTPKMNELIKEENALYFNNVYTNVGIGNTSDAEFSFFTGLYPTGDMTIAWEYDDYEFDIKALGNYLDYTMHSYNPTDEIFYNHKNLHPGLYKTDTFYGLETFEKEFPRKENLERYLNHWILDKEILYWANGHAKKEIAAGNRSFSFVETITPHNPFPDFSKNLQNYEKVDFGLSVLDYQMTNYLNQVRYNDEMIYDFIKDVTNPSSPHYLENTFFILYGDHGNFLNKESYQRLYDIEMTDLEFRRLSLNIPVIFYDPSGNLKNSLVSDDVLTTVKSQRDLHRTLLNLLGSDVETDYYGVNMFSGEPSFSYDPKNFDIITDDFIYSTKSLNFELYRDREIDYTIVDMIQKYRLFQDAMLNKTVYKTKKVIS